MIFTDEFNRFIEAIHSAPSIPHGYDVDTPDARVTIHYVPSQRYGSCGYPSFTQVYSLEENTVYAALARKLAQLEQTGFTGPKGILLCDGGCRFLQSSPLTNLSYAIEDIIHHFLRQYTQIVFIVTFVIRVDYHNPLHRKCWVEPIVYRGVRFGALPFDLFSIIKGACATLPQPETDAANALNWLRYTHVDLGRSFWGGYNLSHGISTATIKIPSRALLELLSGNVTLEDFLVGHGFASLDTAENARPNPFKEALACEQLIDTISLEKSSSRDDDWIIIKLRGPDPAISRFRSLGNA